MKWLITGGCGFVGSNLADELLAQGEEVFILDNLSRIGSAFNLEWLNSKYKQGFEFIKADVRDADIVGNTIEKIKPSSLAHLAGQVAMTTSIENPRLDFGVNAFGTLNILEAVRLTSPETVVMFSSTNKVYGDLSWISYEEIESRYIAPEYPFGFNETIPLDFHSPYGCSKGSADQYVQDYARIFQLKTVVFRHSSIYGDRQFATYDQGWIGWFCSKAIETKETIEKGGKPEEFTITGDGKQVRDILHVKDVAKLYINTYQKIDQCAGNAYNVGGGVDNSLSLLELFQFLEKYLDIDLLIKHIPWRESDQKVFIADNKSVERAINWRPKVTFNQGLKSLLATLSTVD